MFGYKLKIEDKRLTSKYFAITRSQNGAKRDYNGHKMMRCLVRLLFFILLPILVDSNQEKQVK